MLHGGLTIGDHAILGEPEYGYPVREFYPGAGADTVLGSAVIIRAGAVVYERLLL